MLADYRNIEWAQAQMRAKAPVFGKPAGRGSGADWMDRCGAVAHITEPAAKALLSLLIWPDRDWGQDGMCVVSALSSQMIDACIKHGRKNPRGDTGFTVPILANRMAYMVMYMHLYGLYDDYSIKGRLKFAGIHMEVEAYQRTWRQYETAMLEQVKCWIADADYEIGEYRHAMNAESA